MIAKIIAYAAMMLVGIIILVVLFVRDCRKAKGDKSDIPS